MTPKPYIKAAATLVLEAPIPAPGVYGFSALVTHADGVTVSTSNVLAFTTVPEPGLLRLLAAVPWALIFCRRRSAIERVLCKAV